MRSERNSSGKVLMKRAAALVACLLLILFAAGGSLYHQHKNGNEAACQICQSMHAPALASSAVALVSLPTLIARFSPSAPEAPVSNPFSHHRAGRAPPSI